MKKTLFATIAIALASFAVQAAPAGQMTKSTKVKVSKGSKTKSTKVKVKKSAAVTKPAVKAPAATPSK